MSRRNRGSTLIELLVVIGICGMILLAVTQVMQVSLKLTRQSSRRLQAIYLMREGVEGVRYLRDSGWSNMIAPLSPANTYFLVFVTSTAPTYALTTTEPPLTGGLFRRDITVADALRDTQDTIAASGTNDPNTRQVTIRVSWPDGSATSTESLTFYLMNVWQN